jgi:hypothetical protein
LSALAQQLHPLVRNLHRAEPSRQGPCAARESRCLPSSRDHARERNPRAPAMEMEIMQAVKNFDAIDAILKQTL